MPDKANKIMSDSEKPPEKISQTEYLMVWNSLTQKHFEQGSSLDKQILWFSGASIGVSVAYFSEKCINISSYYIFFSFAVAWALLVCSILLALEGMRLGNESFNHDIDSWKKRYHDPDADVKANPYVQCANCCTNWARRTLIIGGLLLIGSFAANIYTRI